MGEVAQSKKMAANGTKKSQYKGDPVISASNLVAEAPSTRNMSKRTSMDHGDPTEQSSVTELKSKKNKRSQKQEQKESKLDHRSEKAEPKKDNNKKKSGKSDKRDKKSSNSKLDKASAKSFVQPGQNPAP